VSFESYSPASIYVDNKSGENLVAFKGALDPSCLISGIPAYASNHGLKKDAGLFDSTGAFALILITEEEYNKHKSDIAAAPVFARIYAFYNHEAVNNNRFQISSVAGGSGQIILSNPTYWDIEIRKDGPSGEPLGYVTPLTINMGLRVNAPADYMLFPVFKRFVPADRILYEVIPKYASGDLTGKLYAKSCVLAQADSMNTWNLEILAAGTFNLTSGSFYLRIINNSSDNAIRFTRGTEEQVTSIGIRGILPGRSETFSIKLERNADGTYPSEQEITGMKIGTPQIDKDIPKYTFKTDYLYTITVSGLDASHLTLSGIDEVKKLDIDEILGLD
jgi:hypothetical protein